MRKNHKQPEPETFYIPVRHLETDTRKLVRLHLQDPNHVITEEEIRSLRVGMEPSLHFPGRHDASRAI